MESNNQVISSLKLKCADMEAEMERIERELTELTERKVVERQNFVLLNFDCRRIWEIQK